MPQVKNGGISWTLLTYIKDHPDEVVTIEDLARHAGTTVELAQKAMGNITRSDIPFKQDFVRHLTVLYRGRAWRYEPSRVEVQAIEPPPVQAEAKELYDTGAWHAACALFEHEVPGRKLDAQDAEIKAVWVKRACIVIVAVDEFRNPPLTRWSS